MNVATPSRPPMAPPPRPPLPVAEGRGQPEPEERNANCTAAWTLICVLSTFKIVTIGLILHLANPTPHLGPMLVAMNWHWLIPLALLLSTVPFGVWFRLVRARARRRQLQRAEWQL